MRDTARWAHWFATDWRQDVPSQIHTAEISPDGSPEWHPDFESWLTAEKATRGRGGRDPNRLRTTKVMRRLRRVAVREYEVLFRVLVQGERIEDTTTWLNERSARNAIPMPTHRPDGPHYTEKDTMALLVAGVGFAKEYW